MTNHVHTIVRSKSGNLSNTIRDIKKHTSKKIHSEIRTNPEESRKKWLMMIFKYHARFNKRVEEFQLWTHHNHAVELSDNEMINSRFDYIHNNPVKAGWVIHPEDYLYSSARNYAGLENIMEIDMI